jgi:MFS transporter, OPA family, glycerol-3-phosphate transporter
MLSYLREQPAAPRLSDAAEIDRRYAALQNQVLYGSMVAYGLFYFCRKNLSVALPLMGDDLGYSNAQLGVLGSWLYVTYGVCKFLSGTMADRLNPRVFMTAGLMLSAMANVVFGLSSAIVVLTAAWAANGLLQSTGAPASAKMLAVWFGAAERGTKTGIWNISHQAGGGIVLLVAGLFAASFGWRGAIIGPAIIALVFGVVVARFLHDHPQAHGLPPIAERMGEADDEDGGLTALQLLVRRVLLNRRVWFVALASCFTYVVRYGALDWAPKYLYEVRQMSIASAGANASLLELTGIPGALLCGWLSDRYFAARRAPVVITSLVLLGASIWLLFRVPAGNPWLDATLLAFIGFFTYGPQMLLAGVAPVDMSSRRVAAAAVGFTGLMSYAGATLSSAGTGWALDRWGWEAAFNFWILAAIVAALSCVPLWRESGLKRAAAPARLRPRASAVVNGPS